MPTDPPPPISASGVQDRPACAICRSEDGTSAIFELGFGVRVWLCAAHRDPAFLVARDGHELVEALAMVWVSLGAMSTRRRQALAAHLALLGPRDPVAVPRRRGSYAWPTLRREAQELLARGEAPGAIVTEIRRAAVARAGADGPVPPSATTIRRWLREDRLLALGRDEAWPNGEPPALPRASGAPDPRPYRR
ncbi:MAG: hypothetical protein AB7V62_06920 [Thermoleophilia bacterium]